jgi:hypothetical protein
MKIDTITPVREQSRFDEVLGDYSRQRAALDSLPIETTGHSETRAWDALQGAEARLMKAPANNISDLRAMAEVIWQDGDSVPGDELLSTFFDNLRRLDGQAPSRTFSPAAWLAWFENSGGGWIEREEEIVLLVPHDPCNVISHAMWALETRGGLEQVKALIRERKSGQQESGQTWGSLLSRYQTAKARLDEHCALPSPEFDDAGLDAYEAKTEKRANAHADLFVELILAPAPDAAGLAFKMQVYADVVGGDAWDRGAEMVAQLAEDARNLAGEA